MPKFVPGQSGNPAGRRPRTDTEKRQRELIRRALPRIIERLIGLASDGDTTASKLLLDRVMPALKPTDRPAPIAIGCDLAQASGAILAALGAGTLTPDQAHSLAGTIASLARSNELIEVEKRLTYVEDLLNERQHASKN